jgi:hypothetical protein
MASGDPALHKLTDLAVELVRLGEIDPEEGLLVVVDVRPGLRQAAVDALGPYTEQRPLNDNAASRLAPRE